MNEPTTVAGKYLRQFRLNTGMTQKRFAYHIGVPTMTVCKWETGKYLPTLKRLWTICNLFMIDPEEILSKVLGYEC